MTEQQPRRERNMDAKRARILRAATKLFAERDFTKVTTQAVSEEADVAVGTLFRYAVTKADLLLMVYNGEFESALSAGRGAAHGLTDPVEAVVALVLPVLHYNAEQPGNTIRYQRELLFGRGPMIHRAEGLRLVGRLEDDIVEILLRAAGHEDERSRQQAERASRLVFAGLSLALAQPSTHAHPELSPVDELRGQVALVVSGFLDGVGPADRPAPEPSIVGASPRIDSTKEK